MFHAREPPVCKRSLWLRKGVELYGQPMNFALDRFVANIFVSVHIEI